MLSAGYETTLRVGWVALSSDAIPRQVVEAALRVNLPFFGIACVTLLVGLSSLLLAWLVQDRLLFWVGIFSVLYAVRLFIQNELVRAATEVRGQELAPWALCITYLIPIPFALFAGELFGRGWNATIAIWTWFEVTFAIVAIPAALFAHQVLWTDSLNGVLIIGGTLLILLHVLLQREGSDLFVNSLKWPLIALAFWWCSQTGDLRPAGVDVEPLGFLILLAGLGLTAARRALAS